MRTPVDYRCKRCWSRMTVSALLCITYFLVGYVSGAAITALYLEARDLTPITCNGNGVGCML